MAERMQKGEVVGQCRYCGKAIVYPGKGPAALCCHRKACKRARSREAVATHRSRKRGVAFIHQPM